MPSNHPTRGPQQLTRGSGGSAWCRGWWLAAALLFATLGCGHGSWLSHSGTNAAAPFSPSAYANPVFVGVTDPEFLWNQLVDTLDDYFKIQREERVQAIGGVLTAGRIDTYPVVGATYLEPWRRDSTHGFERLHATLQSVRRRAVVHVVPVEQGFSIEVVVLKDLEDLSYPEKAASGATAPPRHDGTLLQTDGNAAPGPATLGWIPLGRDLSLEQQIVEHIQARVANFQPRRTL